MECKINYYSAKRLYENGIEQDGMLVCNKVVSDYSLIGINDRENCQLFDQTKKALGDGINLNKVFIILDFNEVRNVLDFKPFINGIKIHINNEDIVFVDYLKSNSMNKNCCIYYINKEYYEIIDERINFGFNNVKQVPLSKWYAYSGLSLSDCHILNNITLSVDEICIIDDKKIKKEVSCITAVSLPVLLNIFKQYKEKIENFKTRPEYYRLLDDDIYNVITLSDCDISSIAPLDYEMNCYYSSQDFDKLSESIQGCINDIIELKNIDMEEIIDYIDDRIYYYEQKLHENKIEWNRISVSNFPIEINYFDGEGLVSLEFAKTINQALHGKKIIKNEEDEEEDESNDDDINYSNSFQIRLPFMKGVIHSCDFKAFFKEHNVTHIKGFNSYKPDDYTLYDVDKIKIILTKSQFKALSFMKHLDFSVKDYFNLLKKYDYHLGISGVEPIKRTTERLCYQFLSTLPINNEGLDNIINRNIGLLKESITEEKVIEHLRLSDSESYPSGLEIYEKNPNFYKSTKIYKSCKTRLFEYVKNSLAIGKLCIDGTRKYLCGDLLAILYHAMGKDINKKNELSIHSFYAPNSNLLEECILLRNPHYSRNEITIMKNNDRSVERKKYFGHLTGVIMCNPYSLAADRLGGADYDGDTVCVVNDKELIQLVKPQILKKNNAYVYPLVKIPSVNYQPTHKDELPYHLRLKSLDATFSNRTGFISNIAFEKTLDLYHNKDFSNYDEISFFTILGGLEIDSCKNGKKPSLPYNKKSTNDFILIKDYFLKRRNTNKKIINPCFSGIKKSHNENLVYYNFYKNIRQKVPKEEILYEVNKIDIPVDLAYIKCYSIEKAFNHFTFSLNLYNEQSKSSENIKQEIIKQLCLIFQKNDIKVDLYSLIKKFQINAYNNFNKYLDKGITPYHYLVDEDEKIRFIKEVLFINNLSIEEFKALTTFENKGFKVLYFILYYNYLSDDKTKLINYLIDNKKKDDLKTSEDFLAIMNSYFDKYINFVIDLIKQNTHIDTVRSLFIKLLTKEAEIIPADVVINVIKPLESKLITSVFKNHILEYLSKEE